FSAAELSGRGAQFPGIVARLAVLRERGVDLHRSVARLQFARGAYIVELELLAVCAVVDGERSALERETRDRKRARPSAGLLDGNLSIRAERKPHPGLCEHDFFRFHRAPEQRAERKNAADLPRLEPGAALSVADRHVAHDESGRRQD